MCACIARIDTGRQFDCHLEFVSVYTFMRKPSPGLSYKTKQWAYKGKC